MGRSLSIMPLMGKRSIFSAGSTLSQSHYNLENKVMSFTLYDHLALIVQHEADSPSFGWQRFA